MNEENNLYDKALDDIKLVQEEPELRVCFQESDNEQLKWSTVRTFESKEIKEQYCDTIQKSQENCLRMYGTKNSPDCGTVLMMLFNSEPKWVKSFLEECGYHEE